MSDRVQEYKEEREWLNKVVLSRDNLDLKRFFTPDSAVYRDGALDTKAKELVGLVASVV